MEENNPVRFGQCCDKCGRAKMSCVCIQKIKVDKTGNGTDGKGISELLKQKRYSRDEIKELLEKLRIELGLYGLYDDSYPDKWIDKYLK